MLMEFKGTKERWCLNENGTMVFAGKTHIASYPVAMSKEQFNDLKLIAYAPKLLEALESAINALEWKFENNRMQFDKADGEKLEEWKELINKIL